MKIPNPTLEVTAANLEEAKRIAADKLNVNTDQLIVTILDETKKLFGKTQVKIMAEVNLVTKAKEEYHKDVSAEARTIEKQEKSEEPVEEIIASQEDTEQMIALTEEILRQSQLNIRVQHKTTSGRYINLELQGSDVGYFIGNHGDPLNALQFLINVVYSKKYKRPIRVILDGNDYRKRREEILNRLALQIAEQVRERGEEAVLDALPAFERRVIHKSLQGYEGITTYSEGEEPNRRVVIAPA